MTAFEFLLEWAVRSSILIAAGGVAVVVLRLKSPSIRLNVWIAILCGSFAMPILMSGPKVPIEWRSAPPPRIAAPDTTFSVVAGKKAAHLPSPEPRSFHWRTAALALYATGALLLLARLGIGVVLSLRLLRRSRLANRTEDGIEIRESDRITAPVTLGMIGPAIVLPSDWRHWDPAKLAAVISHESAHIRRFDPAAQLLSACHRALLWHSPLSWLLHREIVRTAEAASDDAAVLTIGNREAYAEMLMDFMRRSTEQPGAVCMARYGSVEGRIDRILNAHVTSRKLTRSGAALVLSMAAPFCWLVAAAEPQRVQPPAPVTSSARRDVVPLDHKVKATASAPKHPDGTPGYLIGLGNVVPSQTVTVRAPADGTLTEVLFKEGAPVEKDQVVAKIGDRRLEPELALAIEKIDRDRKELAQSRANSTPEALARKEDGIRQQMLEATRLNEQLRLYQLRSPISGIAGLRMVDAGNMVHALDPIVIVTQIQPIAVLFTVPEDHVSVMRARLAGGGGGGAPVEVWNRDFSRKLATGGLTAADNSIDSASGTLKFKAEFDNKDGALFPNQFVNVRIAVGGK